MRILSLPLRSTQAPPPRVVRIRLHPLNGGHPIPLVSVGTIDEVARWVVRTAGGTFLRFADGNALWISPAPAGHTFWVECLRIV